MAKKKTVGKKAENRSPATKRPSATKGRQYWLVKSEPEEFSITDLAEADDQTTCWDGVRNYQARNTLRDEMKKGDWVLYYHSNSDPSGVAGVCQIVKEGYPDHTAFDRKDKHYDPKSKVDAPTWFMVDVKFVEKFPSVLPLSELKQIDDLEGMVLLQRGSRLSVQPVKKEHFQLIRKLGRKQPSE